VNGKFHFLTALLATLLLAGEALYVQAGRGTPALSEYEIKAGYLYNFVKFVDWPGAAFTKEESELTLCVLGEDPFGTALDSLEGKNVKGRTFAIRRLSSRESSERCQVLFVSASEGARLGKILSGLRGSFTLTVGDMENFAEQGGIIHFLTQNNRVRFAINPAAADRAGLSISSKLLKLAIIVREEE
jgi:hypothetical protein